MKTALVLVLTLSLLNIQAQSDENKNKLRFGEKLFTGGNLSLSFGTITNIEVSPILGYKFNDVLAAGIGLNYLFYKDKSFVPAAKTEIYGGCFFARAYFLDVLFIHAEYGILVLDSDFWDPYRIFYKENKFLIGNALAGIGYKQEIGERASTNIMLLYNFNETIYSPYSNPVFRVSLEIGL